jgi:hypothetical protein
MKNTLFKKGLVVGIIVLFVSVSVLSSVSSKDVKVSNNRVVDYNKGIKPDDIYEEIFSYVSGEGFCRDGVGSGLNLFVEFLIGDFFVRSFCLKPFGWHYNEPGSLYIHIYIGDAHPTGNSYYRIDGIALGRVGWGGY